jgi:AcrR family transcriptional regulator
MVEDLERKAPEASTSRVAAALVDLVGRYGYQGLTIETVLERAGVERAEFDAHFESFEACVIQVWNECRDEFLDRSDAAFQRGDDWREGLRIQAWDLCRFVEEDLNRIRFMMDLSSGTELVHANRDVVLKKLADYVDLGRFERDAAADTSREVAEGIVGAIWEGISLNIREDPDLSAIRVGVTQILFMIMLTYLGDEAGRDELQRAPDDIARFERGEL